MKDAVERCKDWIGKKQTVIDDLPPFQARATAALLDACNLSTEPGSPLPPLWHWCYFLATEPQSRLGPDGHPERGGFMPPAPLPRRMFAGSRMRFVRPLALGRPATRNAVIHDVAIKSGQSGPLVFVTVRYEFSQDGELCIEEQQDIVYREPGAAVPAPRAIPFAPLPSGTWSRELKADSRLLFRFSALTFNAHRIHYDRPYATNEEGYPGLVVHGPLTAMLLAELVRAHDAQRIGTFRFQGKAPLFDLAPFRLTGSRRDDRVSLEAAGPDGKPALLAEAELADD